MSVQPAARFVGWESTAKTGTSPAVGAVGRLTPLEIRIDNGEEQTILQIEDPLLQPIRGILAVSLAVSVACILITLAAQIVASRK